VRVAEDHAAVVELRAHEVEVDAREVGPRGVQSGAHDGGLRQLREGAVAHERPPGEQGRVERGGQRDPHAQHVERAPLHAARLGQLGQQLVDVVVHRDHHRARVDAPAARLHAARGDRADLRAQPEAHAEGREVPADRGGSRARIHLQVARQHRAAHDVGLARRRQATDPVGVDHPHRAGAERAVGGHRGGCGLEQRELVGVPGDHVGAGRADPEGRVARQPEPQPARGDGVPERVAGLRRHAHVPEVPHARARGLRAALDDDHREAAAHGRVRRAEADDARADHDDVGALRHRSTRRIHTAMPSTTRTVARIISTIAVTMPYRAPSLALRR
jgi:hypothetical protein